MSATARAARARPRERGFTLLEILVVVVIIAVLTTFAVLSVGVLGADRELESEAGRFADVTAAAREQAQLEGRDYGFHLRPDGYEVLVWSARRQRWEAPLDDRLYATHPLPPGVFLALELEGRPVLLGRESPTLPREPQLLLFGSGDASPYRLVLAREGGAERVVLEGRPDGTIGLERSGDER